jgi:hypothetical protein
MYEPACRFTVDTTGLGLMFSNDTTTLSTPI